MRRLTILRPYCDALRRYRVTHFEFVSIAFSIVYALSIAKGLDALPAAFEPSRRYWVHFTWLCVKLANPAVLWWSAWELRGREEYAFQEFLGVLLIAGTLYLQIVALVTPNPGAVSNWRAHYYAKRNLFFGANIALLIELIVAGPLLFGNAFLSPITFVQIVSVILSGIAMTTENGKVHACIAALAAVNMFGATFGLANYGT